MVANHCLVSPLLGFVDLFDQWSALWCTAPDMFHSCEDFSTTEHWWSKKICTKPLCIHVSFSVINLTHLCISLLVKLYLRFMGKFNQKVFAFGQTETQKCVVSMSNVCWPSLIPRSILIDQTCRTLKCSAAIFIIDHYTQVCNQLWDYLLPGEVSFYEFWGLRVYLTEPQCEGSEGCDIIMIIISNVA